MIFHIRVKNNIEKLTSLHILQCTYWGRKGAYRTLVGKPEGRRPLGRPKRRWEDNIKLDIREVQGGGA
jgi:hypothetical protein